MGFQGDLGNQKASGERHPVKKHSMLFWNAAGLAALMVVVGCARTSDVHQFEPVPQEEVGAKDLEPVEPRSIKELLEEAEIAFRTANEAQEEGDYDAALRHYQAMLEFLIEADLDPEVFYNLREEFARIIEDSSEQVSILERRRERRRVADWDPDVEPLNDLQIPFPLPERVLAEIEEIQELYPRNFQRGLDRSARYMPWIQEQFAKAGLPEDLAWLAMVESQFWPRAVSPAGASGMWQFMRATGERYDLRIDRYVDERFNWERSTYAAINYLTDLYHMFDGDWALAVSGYNMGEYGLQRAIDMNDGMDDLWELVETPPASNRIRLETKEFYPRLLASVIVANNPERYGFEYNPQPELKFERVPVNGSYSLAALERAAGMEEDALKNLNPDLVRGVTPPSGEFKLAIPAGKQEPFMTALNEVSETPAPAQPEVELASASGSSGGSGSSSGRGGTHTVQSGETLSQIAQRYNVTTSELKSANSISSAHRIQSGTKLTIPGAGTVQATASGGGGRTYRVRRGDTLYDIARKENVSVSNLQQWNDMGRRARISVGEVLVVSEPGAGQRVHEVQRGETATHIAQRYGVGVDDLLAWNDMNRNSTLRAGQELVISGGSSGGGTPTTHTVQAGETASVIAQRHGVPLDDLLSWNNLSRSSTLRVGQELTLHGVGSGGGGSETAELTHTVQAGETASVIAQNYSVGVDDLLRWNNLTRSSTLQVGQELVIRISRADADDQQRELLARLDGEAQGSSGERIVHTVTSGQNPTTIARRYGVSVGDLFEWNGWEEGNAPVLHVGNEVVVYQD